jgi:hypothetical protein
MKIISTKLHGLLDYLMGILLIASPWLLGFATGTAAQQIPIILGIAMIIFSFLTNYEWGIIKVISMKTHLTLDILSGLLLAVSPWLFNLSREVYLPHLVLGIAEVLGALMTNPVPRMKGTANPHAGLWPVH